MFGQNNHADLMFCDSQIYSINYDTIFTVKLLIKVWYDIICKNVFKQIKYGDTITVKQCKNQTIKQKMLWLLVTFQILVIYFLK